MLLGAVALNGLLALAWRPAPELQVLHPLAPPLTRIAALGDHPLDPAATPPPPPAELLRKLNPLVAGQGTPAQRQLLQRARAAEGRIDPLLPRAQALRLAVEADAAHLADTLGPARVGRFVLEKERMSAAVGETRVWIALSEELAR
ncbi:MAG: hypothetical protein H6740_21545 [Alphaproteobacteria bacterium]|nr:hypothetical protein [Alphaproteobacteria bacterium]